MQRNCGVLAYDKLAGELNGRANTISMNTLAKLAQDNEFLLYPLKVPVGDIDKIEFPVIVYTDHHFEMWEELQPDNIVFNREYVYILSHKAIPKYIMDETEAKKFRGAGMSGMGGGSAPAYSGGMAINPPSGSQVANVGNWGWSMPSYSSPIMTQSPNAFSYGYGSPSPVMSMGQNTGWSSFGGTPTPMAGSSLNNVMSSTPAVGATGGGMYPDGLGADPLKAYANTRNYLATGPNQIQPAGFNKPFSALGAETLNLKGFGDTGVSNALLNDVKPTLTGLQRAFGSDSQILGGTMDKLSEMKAAGSGVMAGLGGNVGGAAGAAGTPSGTGGIVQMVQNAMKGAVSAGKGAGASSGKALQELAMSVGQNVLPQLLQMGMQKILPYPEAPAFNDLQAVQELRASIGNAKTALGQMGEDELARVLSLPIGGIIPEDNAYYESVMKEMDEAAERRKESITRAYNSYGRINSSEHIEELGKVDKELEEGKKGIIAKLNFEKLTLEQDYKKSALAAALGIEERAAAELAGLAGLAVEEAALKYGLEVAQVTNIRDLFGAGIIGGMNGLTP